MRNRAASSAVVTAAILLSCDSPVATAPPVTDAATPAFVVSEPVSLTAAAESAIARLVGGEVYVSLAPGTFPDGVVAHVEHLASRVSQTRAMIDGGLDPVPVAAAVGERLRVSIENPDGITAHTLYATVPAAAAPRVVRTVPPRKKTDVPLNVRIIIIFTEPMDATTASGVRLLRDSASVSGHAVLAADGLSVEFQPDTLLAPRTEYAIVIDQRVTDRNGAELGAPEVVEFTTEAASPPSPFTSVGSMNAARHGHTATLLLDGRVLVTGGDGGVNRAGRSAEIYDPATRTFAFTDSLLEPRIMHRATLLPNGQVLIVGGWNTSAGAELYDPVAGRFVATGKPLRDQFILSATLLSNGMVLVAGVKSAELFDPATGTFRQAGPYADLNAYADEYWYSAALLKDGRVLLAGMPDCAQVYDPASDSFSASGCLGVAGLELHTSTPLIDGKALIAAGGNDELGGRSTIAQLFDPDSGTFRRTGDLLTNRSAHAAVRLNDGKVLILGGDHNAGGQYAGVLSSAELYDPATSRFAEAGVMTAPRAAPTATLLKNGEVLIAGGAVQLTVLRSAELYRPTIQTSQ